MAILGLTCCSDKDRLLAEWVWREETHSRFVSLTFFKSPWINVQQDYTNSQESFNTRFTCGLCQLNTSRSKSRGWFDQTAARHWADTYFASGDSQLMTLCSRGTWRRRSVSPWGEGLRSRIVEITKWEFLYSFLVFFISLFCEYLLLAFFVLGHWVWYQDRSLPISWGTTGTGLRTDSYSGECFEKLKK